MSDTIERPRAAEQHTARAFLIAPGVAAAVGGVGVVVDVLLTEPVHRASACCELILAAPFLTFFFAVVGYATAAIVGVPVYLFLPERARRCFAVVVPLAGVIAAAPWILADPPWRRTTGSLTAVAALAFVLGAVAGIAFLFLRRAPDARGREDVS